MFAKKRKQSHKKKELIDFNTESLLADDWECSLESFSYLAHCEELYLKRFDHDSIFDMLKNSGVLAKLEEKGYARVIADIVMDESNIHHLNIYSDNGGPGDLLIAIRTSDSKIIPFKTISSLTGNLKMVRFLTLEWISTEDPRASFSATRPQLPGQNKPGLGVLPQIITFLVHLCEAITCDAVLLVADHFHAAYMYSSYAYYADPAREGKLHAVMRDLGNYGLNNITWGFMTGTVKDRRTGSSEYYKPAYQIIPVGDAIKTHFNTRRYMKRKKKAFDESRYILDIKDMEARREEILEKKTLAEL